MCYLYHIVIAKIGQRKPCHPAVEYPSKKIEVSILALVVQDFEGPQDLVHALSRVRIFLPCGVYHRRAKQECLQNQADWKHKQTKKYC